MKYFAETHIGQRKVNEDSYFVDEELGLYIVADGVGGLDKGEVASRITCESIHEAIKNGKELVAAVEEAHLKLLQAVESNEEKKGMASTVVVALFKDNKYQLAWVGDSRAYLWDGGLKLITRDHSYVELLYEKGHITFEQMENHPNKNIISQAIGSDRKEITIDYNEGSLEKGEILLLATDGLYEIAKEKTIIKVIKKLNSLEDLTNTLVSHAAQNQGKDNITLISLQSEENTSKSEDVKRANVVRTFNSDTGAVETKETPKEPEQESKVVVDNEVKIIKPKIVEPKATEGEITINILHMVSFLIIIVLLMVVITLMM